MPLFDYLCPKCGRVEDVWAHHTETELPCRNACGETMRRTWTRSYAVHGDLDYYDGNLETQIRSRKHRDRVMAEKGVSEKFGKGWI